MGDHIRSIEEILDLLKEGADANTYFAIGPDETPLLRSLIDGLRKDALRYRWLCDGHGYFMEEEGLCGHGNEKEAADKAIDDRMCTCPIDEDAGGNRFRDFDPECPVHKDNT